MFEAFSHSWENEDTLGGVLYQECRKGRELKKMEKHICSLQFSWFPTTNNYIFKGSLVANFRYTNFWVAWQE